MAMAKRKMKPKIKETAGIKKLKNGWSKINILIQIPYVWTWNINSYKTQKFFFVSKRRWRNVDRILKTENWMRHVFDTEVLQSDILNINLLIYWFVCIQGQKSITATKL